MSPSRANEQNEYSVPSYWKFSRENSAGLFPQQSQSRRLAYLGMKIFLRNWAPPALIRVVQSALDYVRPAPWEYVPSGWSANGSVRGWNDASIVRLQKKTWSAYGECVEGTSPLWLNHENPAGPNTGDLRDHNTLISFAYVLALAAHRKRCLSVLDWGGGIGHYYRLSKAVLPGVEIDYHCHDLPVLCETGRELLPDVHFCENVDESFCRQYDLVLASSSLWYEENWRCLLDKLISATTSYLYVTRLVFVNRVPSYVAIQRPWAMGYDTEYLCWILNRQEFISHLNASNMELMREFMICNGPHICRAPEQGDYRGFLFRKRAAGMAERAVAASFSQRV